MDGAHDLGGREGFGPVDVAPDEPVFRHDWERRVFACNFAALGANADRFRHAIERMGAVEYLTKPLKVDALLKAVAKHLPVEDARS